MTIKKRSIKEKREEIKKTKRIEVCKLNQVKGNFTIIANAAITLLDSEALHVYIYLLSKCMNKPYCYPSRAMIVSEIGVNKNKLDDIFKYLKGFGLLEIKKRKRGTHFNNIYHLSAIKKVVEIKEFEGSIIEKEL